MYFNGNISIAPTQLKHIQSVKPQKAFKRILYFLTLGLVSDKMEQETFTAVSILQQFYNVFKAMNTTNLVRLSHDGIDFYLDSHGKDDDLKETLDKYEIETNEAMSIHFNKLNMVLEHTEGSFRYLINVVINRNHQVGAHPIHLSIDALLHNFAPFPASTIAKQLKKSVFKNQDNYDSFVAEKQQEFDNFLNKIKFELNKAIHVDDVQVKSQSKIIIPKKEYGQASELQNWNPQALSPVYHGYYGAGDVLMYSMVWSSLCYSQNIHVSNTALVSEDGYTMKRIDATGIDAGTNSLFDNSLDFDTRVADSGLSFHEGADGLGGEFGDMAEAGADGGGGWLGGDGDSSDGGGSDGGSDGGSSCSSCSSCGGGCGGGD